MNKDVPVFRKGLSTIVETVIEAKCKKPVWNYYNNVVSMVDKIKKSAQFGEEAVYLIEQSKIDESGKSKIDEIIKEMITWYTSKAAGSYDPLLVVPVCNRVTNIVVVAVGESLLLDKDLAEWDAKQKA